MTKELSSLPPSLPRPFNLQSTEFSIQSIQSIQSTFFGFNPFNPIFLISIQKTMESMWDLPKCPGRRIIPLGSLPKPYKYIEMCRMSCTLAVKCMRYLLTWDTFGMVKGISSSTIGSTHIACLLFECPGVQQDSHILHCSGCRAAHNSISITSAIAASNDASCSWV